MQHALLLTKSVLGVGIRSALERIPDWSVRHEPTQIPEEIVGLVQYHPPTVTIFDMTCLDVRELFQQLGQERVKLFGMITVATLSGLDEKDLFFLSKWGVAAHVSGSTDPSELASVLRKVALGEYLLSSNCLRQARMSTPRPPSKRVSERQLVVRREEPPVAQEAPPLLSPLTSQEADILYCIAQGKTNKEIALVLGLGKNTIRDSITSIFEKLQVYDRTSAVVRALQRKWIHMPEIPLTCVAQAAVA